jgi:hypothetical protein
MLQQLYNSRHCSNPEYDIITSWQSQGFHGWLDTTMAPRQQENQNLQMFFIWKPHFQLDYWLKPST